LRPALTISGRVVDKKGAGIPVAFLTLKVGHDSFHFTQACQAYTDPDGYFEIPAVAKQEGEIRYYLTVEAFDHGSVFDQKVFPTVTPDGRGELEDVVLDAADATITGVLVNAKGEAMSGTQITLIQSGHIRNENGHFYNMGEMHQIDIVMSDAQGKFIFPKVVLGRMYYMLADAGGKRAEAFPKGGDQNVRLALTQDTPHW
jgi:hypothetical protein